MELRDNEHLDRWLDSALQKYGEAEPRAGLEGRVLANLRTAAESSTRAWRWWPVFAVMAAIFVVGAAIYLGGAHQGAENNMASVPTPDSLQPQSPITSVNVPTLTAASANAAHKKRAQPTREFPLAKIEPRLERFPAPRPLTSQEQLLARYIQDRPEEAKRLAQAQADLFRKDLAEFEKQYRALEPQPTSSQ